jgi:hypothetical protein
MVIAFCFHPFFSTNTFAAVFCDVGTQWQDGRLAKAPNFYCQERTKYTPDKRGFDPVPQRSPKAGRMVLKLRPVLTLAGAKADNFRGSGWPSG